MHTIVGDRGDNVDCIAGAGSLPKTDTAQAMQRVAIEHAHPGLV